VFWNDGDGYELSYGSVRFEFDDTGKLTESLVGTTKYQLDEISTSCNVPDGVFPISGIMEVRGSDESSYTCEECYEVMEKSCTSGIQQICDYAPGVSDNSPSIFNSWSKNAFAIMCEAYYSACEFGRVDVECDMTCSDADVNVLEPVTCSEYEHPPGYIGCHSMEDTQAQGTPIPQGAMSSDICSNICSSSPFYMTFKGNLCQCVDSFTGTAREEGSCITACKNTPGEFCGGDNLGVSLYENI